MMTLAETMEEEIFRTRIDPNAKDPKGEATIDTKIKTILGVQKIRRCVYWNIGYGIVQHLSKDEKRVNAIYVGKMSGGVATGPGMFVLFDESGRVKEESIGEWQLDTMKYGKFKSNDRVEFGKFHLGQVNGIISLVRRDKRTHVSGTFREGASILIEDDQETAAKDDTTLNQSI